MALTDADVLRMQNEAVSRVREMRHRARKLAGRESTESSQVAESVLNAHTQEEARPDSRAADSKPVVAIRENKLGGLLPPLGSLKSLTSIPANLIANLGISSDVLILGALIYLLSKEEDNMNIILALCYVLL